MLVGGLKDVNIQVAYQAERALRHLCNNSGPSASSSSSSSLTQPMTQFLAQGGGVTAALKDFCRQVLPRLPADSEDDE